MTREGEYQEKINIKMQEEIKETEEEINKNKEELKKQAKFLENEEVMKELKIEKMEQEIDYGDNSKQRKNWVENQLSQINKNLSLQ